MKYFIIIALLAIPQISFGEIVYFDIVSIDGTNLISRSEKYTLGETAVVRNQKEKPVGLREIKLPAKAKADFLIDGDENVLNWVVLIDRKNNEEIPE